ncbi:hypothetical protein JVU11DRAFT_434 [Chiua virens]|nr:hypothetical protein JVU11DRAFT_434 [Chiua virens]
MKLSQAHKGFLQLLSSIVISDFLSNVGHDWGSFNLTVGSNSGLVYLDTTGKQQTRIPDFQLMISNNIDNTLQSKWIGEICFTVSPSDTHEQLKQIIACHPEVDLIFIIIVEEWLKWASLGSKDLTVQGLHFQPLLLAKEFMADTGNTFSSIMKRGFK